MNVARRQHLKSHPSHAEQSSKVPYRHYGDPPSPHTTTSSVCTSASDLHDASPAKRPRLSGPDLLESPQEAPQGFAISPHQSRRSSMMTLSPTDVQVPGQVVGEKGPTAASKSRRVRTGCLTCRERHLKCDEGHPICVNCKKSSRECKRGIRLNFIDTRCKSPPYVPKTLEWSVHFQDESRLIASEYEGGLSRYPLPGKAQVTPPPEPIMGTNLARQDSTHKETLNHDVGDLRRDSLATHDGRSLASDGHSMLMSSPRGPIGGGYDLPSMPERPRQHMELVPQAVHRMSTPSVSSPMVAQATGMPPSHRHEFLLEKHEKLSMTPTATTDMDYIATDEEMRLMRVFIDEVAVWMEALEPQKHFSRVVPYLALKSVMLFNAIMACGVKQLTLVASYDEAKGMLYYDTATTLLLRSLKNPDRNMAECTTTAVVLNVYEIMSEAPAKRMQHIAGARALLRECGWNAHSRGIGAACFWLNIGMEVLSCLAFNWHTVWDPDEWGLDFDFADWGSESRLPPRRNDIGGLQDKSETANSLAECEEETWVQRIFYILAKIGNFRASVPQFQESSPHVEEARKASRYAEWKRLSNMCTAWNRSCPRAMRPLGYAHGGLRQSCFPNIWLIPRTAIIGRLFYHTAMCLLAQLNPRKPANSPENRETQLHHAHQVCGIIAHNHDRGAASIAIRSVAIASSVLTDRAEQDEVLALLARIHRETGWRLEKVVNQLYDLWGRTPSTTGSASTASTGGHTPSPAARPLLPPPQRPTNTSTASGIPVRSLRNPMLARADFCLPDHPYMNWWVPPNRERPVSSW